MAEIVFSDGGAYHRPGRPHLFEPGLRAAAHYLKAVELVDASARRKLFEVLDRLDFPSDFLGWRGLRLTPDEVALENLPDRSPTVDESEFLRAKPFLEALQRWLNRYHMWSPFVLDLLFRTLQLRDEVRRDLAYANATVAEWANDDQPLAEDERERLRVLRQRAALLTEELDGWGWWVEFLSTDVTVPQLEAWFQDRTAESESHSRLFERMDLLGVDFGWETAVSASPFHLTMRGWRPELETWATAKARFEEGFRAALKEYRRAVGRRPGEGHLTPQPQDSERVRWGEPHTWEPAPTKYGDEHFGWLALRQIKGLRPQEIADRPGIRKSVSAVNEAIEGTARLLQLKLRPVRPGPPSVLGD